MKNVKTAQLYMYMWIYYYICTENDEYCFITE